MRVSAGTQKVDAIKYCSLTQDIKSYRKIAMYQDDGAEHSPDLGLGYSRSLSLSPQSQFGALGKDCSGKGGAEGTIPSFSKGGALGVCSSNGGADGPISGSRELTSSSNEYGYS